MMNHPKNLEGIYHLFRRIKIPFKILFLIMGIISTLWFLVRVIPKPSRAAYPCMRTAAPFMSGFVMYLVTLFTASFAIRLAGRKIKKSMHLAGSALIVAAAISSLLFLGSNSVRVRGNTAGSLAVHTANEAMGEGVGIYPGRVVWAWDSASTNANCTNSGDDAYFYPQNNDQEVIDRMVSDALQRLTGQDNDTAAWSAMFRHFNGMKWNEPDWDYVEYEDIFIKTNATSTWGYPNGTYILSNFSVRSSINYIAETNPHVVLAVLRQLVNVVGARQEDIWVGDPMKHIYKHAFDLWHNEFPDINYIGSAAGDGRIKVVSGNGPVIFYSDKGTVMTGAVSDRLYTVMEEADYMINIPTLKAHARAGITLSAKNNFGSHARGGASHLHRGLVAPEEGPPTRASLGMYRVQVDLMGHKMIGRNTMLILVDGLYAGPEATWPADKWNMEPFAGDWTSSLFASMDQVALESVCFDFLRTEYLNKTVKDSRGNNQTINFPNMAAGVDDYLEQAADPLKWPENITYDPEDDGEALTSLGAHEHWNGTETKQYSRNLGLDQGIELVSIPSDLVASTVNVEEKYSAREKIIDTYPNPFTEKVSLRFTTNEQSSVKIDVYDIRGQLVSTLADRVYSPGVHTMNWDGRAGSGSHLSGGIYIVSIKIDSPSGIKVDSRRIQILR
jgi:hypothetical protein